MTKLKIINTNLHKVFLELKNDSIFSVEKLEVLSTVEGTHFTAKLFIPNIQ